jgi:hypothetical protein
MKTYTLTVDHSRRGSRDVSGTVEELTKYFGYTLEIGHSYDRRVSLAPKTIKSLITNLQKAYSIKEGSCYERTSISLKAKEVTKGG